jgi:hypothetical protein
MLILKTDYSTSCELIDILRARSDTILRWCEVVCWGYMLKKISVHAGQSHSRKDKGGILFLLK